MTTPATTPPKARLPKRRQEKPGYFLKPASRAAWARGCTCFTLTGLESELRLPDGGWLHTGNCPLQKTAL